MGLINYAANIQQEVMSSANIMDTWRGKLAEQIVAQELLSNTTDADAIVISGCETKVMQLQSWILCMYIKGKLFRLK